MIPKQVETLLRKAKFVPIATSSQKAEPNVAPKFLIDIKGNSLYLVDYVVNLTWKNIRGNPLAAISVSDEKTLTGYQLRGNARILPEGREYQRISRLLKQKVEQMSVDLVVAAVRSGRKSEGYKLLIPAEIVVFKVVVKELFIISPTGTVKKERLGKMTVSGQNPVVKTDLETKTIPLFYPPMLKQLPEGMKTNKNVG